MTVARELETDAGMLDAVEHDRVPSCRVWTTATTTVVIGRSVDADVEVRRDYCDERGIAVVRRSTGGRSVLVGPGTLQYSFALPYELAAELDSISGAKRFCNRIVLAALASFEGLSEDESGDLVMAGRKAGGLALKRRRNAMLLHGTLLCTADLREIARALRHPTREPAYRAGRDHLAFLTNLGPVDARAFEGELARGLAKFARASD